MVYVRQKKELEIYSFVSLFSKNSMHWQKNYVKIILEYLFRMVGVLVKRKRNTGSVPLNLFERNIQISQRKKYRNSLHVLPLIQITRPIELVVP